MLDLSGKSCVWNNDAGAAEGAVSTRIASVVNMPGIILPGSYVGCIDCGAD
jgi:Flp pilus assembly protein CpaB